MSVPNNELDQFLKNLGPLLDEGLIPARIWNSPEIHEAELNRLFPRCWLFVGHETEIPNAGDYVLRYLGNDSFIFARDNDGHVRVLFNACRHRGSQVCRVEKGNASHFQCPYHGWTYANDGTLAGMPAQDEVYPQLDRSKWGLLSAPRIDSIFGLVFASFAETGPTLREYLGDLPWYLQMVLGITEGGMEVVGEPERWRLTGNWKSGAENLGGDDYHILNTHKTVFEVGLMEAKPPISALAGYHIQAGNGHTFAISSQPPSVGEAFSGYPRELVPTLGTGVLNEDQYRLVSGSRIMLGNIFPNVSFLTNPLSPSPNTMDPQAFTILRLWRPIASDVTEAWNWVLVPKEASEEFKKNSYRAAMANLGSAGYFEQDDGVAFEGITRTAGSYMFGKRQVTLNYQMGMPSMGGPEPCTDWPGPGVAYPTRLEEGAQRVFYRRWLEYLADSEAPFA